MKKGIVAALIALSFMLCTVVSSFAGTGVVKAVEGTTVTVTMDDGTEATAEGAAKVGDKVTVKDGKIAAPKKAAIEGC
jgi:endonuclease YncB( thermonuclease family)